MNPTNRILLAIEDSDASRHAVEAIATSLADRPDTAIHLFHIVGPIPTELLEHGGASDPAAERRLEEELESKQARWLADERVKSQPLFHDAERALVAAGVDPNAISTACCESIPEDDLAELIFSEAREAGCTTIVVGRNTYSWFGELFHRHVADALRSHANGIEVQEVG